MSLINTRQWEVLERWSPTLFLLAGVLLVGYAVLNGIAAFTDTAYVAVEDVVGPGGLVLGFLGALGLYRRLAGRTPRLARAGAYCISLGVVGFSGITLQGFAVIAGLGSTSAPGILLLLVAVGMIPGYLSFGLASLRADAHFRTLSPLLCVPAVVFAAMLSQPFVYGQLGLFSETTMAWSNFVISSGQAVAHLVIGYELRVTVSPEEREAPATDVTVG